jgi:hypothetical protein
MRLPSLLAYAFVSFVAANLIHNNGGLDPAILPATVLAALYWWRPGPGLLRATAVVIALPSLFFFKWAALTNPTAAKPFLNHLALFLAGMLAIASVALSFSLHPQTRVRT